MLWGGRRPGSGGLAENGGGVRHAGPELPKGIENNRLPAFPAAQRTAPARPRRAKRIFKINVLCYKKVAE